MSRVTIRNSQSFSKNGPKSRQVKKRPKYLQQSPKYLQQTTFETLKYPQQTTFETLIIPTTNHF